MLEKSGQSCNSSAGESVKITDIISPATSANRILSDLLDMDYTRKKTLTITVTFHGPSKVVS